MNRKYLILAIILSVFVVTTIVFLLFYQKNNTLNKGIVSNQDINREVELPTSLFFYPNTINIGSGQVFSSGVNISTENTVTGIDVEFVYDPLLFQINKITPVLLLGSFVNSSNWQVIKNEVNNKAGNARFVAFTVDPSFGITGKTGILEVEGVTKELGDKLNSYKIDYGPLTVVSAQNKGYNVLSEKSPLILNILKNE